MRTPIETVNKLRAETRFRPVTCLLIGFLMLSVLNIASASSTFLQINGKAITLFTNKNVHGTVILFVAPECPIANRYAPIMEDLKKVDDPQFIFWVVYPGEQELENIQKHHKDYWPKFKALLDPKHELTDSAQARRTPQAAVFNRAGKLVYTGRIDDRAADFGKWRPYATDATLENALRALSTNQNIRLPSAAPVGCSIPR